jgi:hypothetical protein
VSRLRSPTSSISGTPYPHDDEMRVTSTGSPSAAAGAGAARASAGLGRVRRDHRAPALEPDDVGRPVNAQNINVIRPFATATVSMPLPCRSRYARCARPAPGTSQPSATRSRDGSLSGAVATKKTGCAPRNLVSSGVIASAPGPPRPPFSGAVAAAGGRDSSSGRAAALRGRSRACGRTYRSSSNSSASTTGPPEMRLRRAEVLAEVTVHANAWVRAPCSSSIAHNAHDDATSSRARHFCRPSSERPVAVGGRAALQPATVSGCGSARPAARRSPSAAGSPLQPG